jgi:hypothetical protein
MVPRRLRNIPTLIPQQKRNRRRNLPRLCHSTTFENDGQFIYWHSELPCSRVEWLLHHLRVDSTTILLLVHLQQG